MVVLGITHVAEHNASACIIKNGKLVTWVEEERFLRIKNAPHFFPIHSIKYCLEKAGVTIDKVDRIATSWIPYDYLEESTWGPQATEMGEHTGMGKGFHYVQENHRFFTELQAEYHQKMCVASLTTDLPSTSSAPFPLLKLDYWKHHDCHAMSAIIPSGFKSTNFFTCDGEGQTEAGIMGHFIEKSGMTQLGYIDQMSTIGGFYAAATGFLGFTPHKHEGKVMGLACYGKVNTEAYPLNFHYNKDGLKLPMLAEWKKFIWKDMDPALRRKIQGNYISEEGTSFAATVQHYFEEMILYNIKRLNEINPCDNLVLAGGSFLNCTCNGKIAREIPNVWIQPGAADQGTALGAAILSWKDLTGEWPNIKMDTAYLGRSFANGDIEEVLKNKGIEYTHTPKPSEILAKLIHENNVVGWFQEE